MFTIQGPELHLEVSELQRSVLLLEVSTLQGPELNLDVSALQRSVLLLEVSTVQYRGLSCIWTCLHFRGVYCSWRCLQSTLHGPELHLDMSALQRSVLLLEVSTIQGPELHLDLSAL